MQELDELIAMFGPDAATARALIEKNPNVMQRMTNSETVFRALVDGDQPTLERYSRPVPPVPAPVSTAPASTSQAAPPSSAPAITLDEIIAKLDDRYKDRYVTVDKFGELASARAQEVLNAERPKLITSAINFADEVYTLRNTYETEFPGKKFDRPGFEKFVTEHPNYSSLTDAFNAMVQDDRVQARIEKGVADGIAAQQTTNVPGGSLPTANTMLGAMIRKNHPTEVARGDNLDKAAAAFRALQTRNVN